MSATTDGGQNWNPIAPFIDDTQFSQAFEMDPKNANHLVLPGREIAETTKGADTKCDGDQLTISATGGLNPAHIEQACDWVYSFDTGQSPGGGDWQSSAVSVDGTDVYVGLCGVCDIITEGAGNPAAFNNGIATNVKPDCAPATGASACWHVVPNPKGLPARYIGDVAVDPTDRNTVYAALAGYGRKWYPPNEANPRVGHGHVFVSHDRGETFSDLSANLPDVPANAILVRGDRLYVGTDLGVFTAPKSGGAWTRLGSAIPNAAVFDLNLNPQGTKLVAATHGRGVWVYDFGGGVLAPVKTPTKVLGKKTAKSLPATGAEDTVTLGLALAASALLLSRRRSRV
jgi:LPXTG-motif cell wall-anchored protein